MSGACATRARSRPAEAAPALPRPARRPSRAPAPPPVASLTAIPVRPSVQPKCAACEAEDELAVQPRLEVGPVGDRYETEADHIAGRVMAMRDVAAAAAAPPAVQPKCASCAQEDEVRRQPEANEDDEVRARRQMASEDEEEARPRRQVEAEEDEEVRASRQPGAETRSDAGIAHLAVSEAQLTRGGSPLPDATRHFYEPRLGRDLSGVRAHQGGEASAFNDSIRARAFTYRDHIWLGRTETAGPSFTMAHELAHVMQQTSPGPVGPPAAAQRQPQAHATPSAKRPRRFVAFWQEIGSHAIGACARGRHDQYGKDLQAALVAENPGLVSEVRIPGATATRRYPTACGFADLYKSKAGSTTGTVPGIERTGANTGSSQPRLRKIAFDNDGNCPRALWFCHPMGPTKDYTTTHGYPNIASTDPTTGAQKLSNCSLAPQEIWMGDVKPGHNKNAREAAEKQVERYGKGITATAKTAGEVDSTCTWKPSTGYLAESQVKIPKEWLHTRRGDWTIKALELRLSSGSSLGSQVFAPQTGPRGGTHQIKGRLSAVKDPKYTNGTWVYFVEPNPSDLQKQLTRSNPPPNFHETEKRLGSVLGCLKSTPGDRKRLCRRPKPGRVGPADTEARRPGRVAVARTARPSVRRKKLPKKDGFSLKAWNKMRKGRAGATPQPSLKTQIGKDVPKKLRKKIEFQGNAVESLDWMKRSLGVSTTKPATSKALLKDKNTLEKAMFWSGETPGGDLAGIFGSLRKRLGGLYIKGAKAYNKARAKIRKAFKKAKFSAGGGSSVGKAAGKVVGKIFAQLGKVVLTRTAAVILDCLESGFAQFIEEKVTGNLEQLVEQVDEVKKYVDKLAEDITSKITSRFETFIADYKSAIDTMAKDAKLIGKIAGAVTEIVKIARMAFCASGLIGAGWGAIATCLLSIADWIASKFDKSPLDWVIKKVMNSCRGRRLFAHALLSFDAIKKLPERLAKGILGELKAVLPKEAQGIICDLDALVVPKLSMADYQCSEGGGGGGGAAASAGPGQGTARAGPGQGTGRAGGGDTAQGPAKGDPGTGGGESPSEGGKGSAGQAKGSAGQATGGGGGKQQQPAVSVEHSRKQGGASNLTRQGDTVEILTPLDPGLSKASGPQPVSVLITIAGKVFGPSTEKIVVHRFDPDDQRKVLFHFPENFTLEREEFLNAEKTRSEIFQYSPYLQGDEIGEDSARWGILK